jgi:arylsulfatase A-like enzyme
VAGQSLLEAAGVLLITILTGNHNLALLGRAAYQFAYRLGFMGVSMAGIGKQVKYAFAIVSSLILLFVTSGVNAGEASEPQASEPRNFVFFLVDDLGWTDLGCFGSTFHETPNIDRLAQRGMKFTQAYAACSVCSPTRASIMTGRHPVRVDITDWIPGQDASKQKGAKFQHVEDRDELALEELTIAELLRAANYQTFFVGKWHLGDRGFLPTDQGFDVNIAGYSKGSPPGGYYSPFKNPFLEDHQKGEYLTERLTDESIQLIEKRDKQRPFFLHFCYYNVHTPIQPYNKRVDHFRSKAEKFEGPTPVTDEHEGKTRMRQDNPEYASMVAAVDQSVGQLLDVLDREGIANNTVVVFFSDNGGLSTLGKLGPTCNAPLRSGKGWLYEGGIREPMIVAAPGIVEAGTVCASPVFSTDFFPTLAELGGVEVPWDLQLDGQSIVGLLGGGAVSERTLYWHYPHYHGSTWKPGAAIRDGDWKLIEFYHWDNFELYNLAADPGEQNNLASEMPEVAGRLREKLAAWQKVMGARMPVAVVQ